MPENIPQYIQREQIDTSKWNKCIDEAANGLIYGYSYYLDHTSKQWDGLVLNDYQVVMPLTWNRKFGIYYLTQPPFAAALGIFGNNLYEDKCRRFIDNIPSKFKLVDIFLNYNNMMLQGLPGLTIRSNYVLGLARPYEDLKNNYRENIRRNIKKAEQLNCTYTKNIPVVDVINLAKTQMRSTANLTEIHFENFARLYSELHPNGKAKTYGAYSSNGQLVASAVYFFSHHRAYYILVGNHPNSKTIGASHYLIDQFIKDHAGQELYLDFEGSDIRNLAFFYSSFGAVEENYPALYRNSLPWYLKWMKK